MTHFSSYYYMKNKIMLVFRSLASEPWLRKISYKNKKSHYSKKNYLQLLTIIILSTRMNCEVDQMA